MKHLAIALWISLIFPLLLPAQNPGPSSAAAKQPDSSAHNDEAAVLAAIRERLSALEHRDFDAWSRYVSDDWIVPLGGTKKSWLAEHCSWPTDVKYWYGPLEDIRIQIFGDTAVASYRAKQFNEMGGQTTYINKWQLETHMRHGPNWLLVATGDAAIPLEPTAAKVDPAIFDAYAGQYEWTPKLVSTITRDGDHLMEEFSGQGKSELLPESETTFFVKGEAGSGDSSRIIFVKGADGRVAHYIYREYGGTDRIVKKIK